MSGLTERAISSAIKGKRTFVKYISANDTGLTRSHQVGYYIGKKAVPILFDTPGIKGTNKERAIRISWQDGSVSDSMAKYYGTGTRNEYRVTRFGKGFEFLRHEYTGSMLVLVQHTEDEYEGYVLSSDEDMEEFRAAFDLSPTDSSILIDAERGKPEKKLDAEMSRLISGLMVDFPDTEEMSEYARRLTDFTGLCRPSDPVNIPDRVLLLWTDVEYRLFRAIENERYGPVVRAGFESMDRFVEMANTVLNKRKSRAGKGFEHHLSALFERNGLRFSGQCVTEGNRRPDFIFPSSEAYHDASFPDENLVFLGAKTTCKDRWRQILNEAERFRNRDKFLVTLQQGVSPAQMDEMQEERVILVVPKEYHGRYPEQPFNYRSRLWTLERFIRHVREIQGGQI